MKISIGFRVPGEALSGIRYIMFKREATSGDWYGEGHGYRFKVQRRKHWTCVVYRAGTSQRIESAVGHKMKWVVQEATRKADLLQHPPGCTCAKCEAFRDDHNVAHGT